MLAAVNENGEEAQAAVQGSAETLFAPLLPPLCGPAGEVRLIPTDPRDHALIPCAGLLAR